MNNKEIALLVSKSIMNGDWEKLDSLLHEDFSYSGDGMNFNKDEYIGFMQDLYLGMRKMQMEFPQVYEDGEFVTIRFINPMWNLGKFMGVPATKKKIISEGIFISQVRDEKVIKENQTTDILGIMTQMGAGALIGYTVAVGILKVKQKSPVRKSIEEMKVLDEKMKKLDKKYIPLTK